MRFVRFTGSTPYLGTAYQDLMEFPDSKPIEEIVQMSRDIALRQGLAYRHLLLPEVEEMDPLERAKAYVDYFEYCVNFSKYELLDAFKFQEYIDMEDD